MKKRFVFVVDLPCVENKDKVVITSNQSEFLNSDSKVFLIENQELIELL